MTEKKNRILLVEDEPNLAFNIEYNLQSEGYEVVLAADGSEALSAFDHNGPFALIILDIMLPKINGLEVASIIRSKDKITQILMLTARAAENDVIRGLEQGADDYMTKPFSFKELLLRVRRMADRSELFHQTPLKKENSIKIKQTRLIQTNFCKQTCRMKKFLMIISVSFRREFSIFRDY